MKIENIADLQVLVHTARGGTLTAAAAALGITPAAASATLKRLESQLGARLFERSTRAMRLTPQGQTLLIVGGAGGVGSILIQLARQLTQLRVIATASRPETRAWCLELGAHAVIDHSKPLAGELKAAGIGEVEMVASLTQTGQHYAQIIESLQPQGRMAVIDDLPVLDAMALKTKCISLHWEMMFARSRFETADMARQGELLAEVAQLVDAGRIRTTANASFGTINAANLRRAHALIESGKAQGKVVLAGF